MRKIFVAVIISLLAANAIAQPDTPPEKQKPERERERLGLRAGYAGTSSNLRNTFGSGVNLGLHWIQHVKYPLFINATLGAFYMGKTDREDITFNFFKQSFDSASMRLIRFTAAPYFEFPIRDRTTAYVSAGGGYYIVSLLLDDAFQEFDNTDSHFGVNFAAGLTRRITQNWFIEFHTEAHKLWTSNDPDDLFFVYSEGDQDPWFFDITVGVQLRLF
jgi:opacity protein-like surface antigen